MYAVLVRAGDSWRGVKISEFELRQLQALREELEGAHSIRPDAPSAAGKRPAKVSSRIGT
jgi:hypothetical protein